MNCNDLDNSFKKNRLKFLTFIIDIEDIEILFCVGILNNM